MDNGHYHFIISIIKSIIRIIAGGLLMFTGNIMLLFVGGLLIAAEVLGIIEELVDDRK